MHIISRAITKTIKVVLDVNKSKFEVIENGKVIETKSTLPYYEGQFNKIYQHYKEVLTKKN